ncbi:hypothetical protein E2C01_040621 [Portunus trituberculatus]|uniref:Uncharacterized protein n=1 Tax=Portunus trituberculatus TaxID=210409 RepID=A0A5B7FHX3_PORTR|nr:hypothetical protein [Portunus trituberculatus]
MTEFRRVAAPCPPPGPSQGSSAARRRTMAASYLVCAAPPPARPACVEWSGLSPPHLSVPHHQSPAPPLISTVITNTYNTVLTLTIIPNTIPPDKPPTHHRHRHRHRHRDRHRHRLHCRIPAERKLCPVPLSVNTSLAASSHGSSLPQVPEKYVTPMDDNHSLDGMVEARRVLQFVVGPQHFVNGQMKLRCSASISTLYYKTQQHSVDGHHPYNVPVMESRDHSAMAGADKVRLPGSGCHLAVLVLVTLTVGTLLQATLS